MQLLKFLSTALLAGAVAAHPGHDPKAEAEVRRDSLLHSKKDLSHCAEKLKERGHTDRQIARRQELARSLRLSKGISKRAASDLNKSHHSDEEYTLETDPAFIFEGNSSCVLAPEVIEGPYYVAGEYVRKNIVDDQEGVPLYFDTQLINIHTCEPVPDVYVEIWHCNSTGVYSGVIGASNGNSDDQSNVNNTFLRGIQKADEDGITTFESLFPGHYTMRTTHIHVMVHIDAHELPNGTLMDTRASHVGQVFFDQDLINQVEETSPYTDNTQELWLNEQDDLLAQELESSDPIMEYVLLGDDVSDGVLAWLSFAIDPNYFRNVSAAAWYYKDGGVANPTEGGVTAPSVVPDPDIDN